MKKLFASFTVLLIALTGCSEGTCCQQGVSETLNVNKIDDTGNSTPIANFKDLEIVSTGTKCTFSADGSSSSDSDGDVSSYKWTINETEVSTSINPTDTSFPCAATLEEPIIVCLIVVDDKGASSTPNCTTVDLTESITEPEPTPEPELIPPTAKMNFIKATDEDAYIFNCDESHDNDDIDTDNNATNDPNVVKCYWSVFKTALDGSRVGEHEKEEFTKWMSTAPDKYTALHVTLTVTDDDNQTDTITNSYELQPD